MPSLHPSILLYVVSNLQSCLPSKCVRWQEILSPCLLNANSAETEPPTSSGVLLMKYRSIGGAMEDKREEGEV